jgi:hypothetical protein
MKTLVLRSLLAGLLVSAQPAGAWGLKAHQMQVRAVMPVLPAEMPAIFRDSAEHLIFLGTEPDRWRAPENPSLTEATGPNHFFSHELALNPMPPNRHAFLVELAKAGKVTAAEPSLKPFGLAPYAIQEWGEMLTGAFRRWRVLPEDTPLDRTRKRQHEQSILFMAGVLAHWVTDVSQPMHCSIHILGWNASAPNPTTTSPHATSTAATRPSMSSAPSATGMCRRHSPLRRENSATGCRNPFATSQPVTRTSRRFTAGTWRLPSPPGRSPPKPNRSRPRGLQKARRCCATCG